MDNLVFKEKLIEPEKQLIDYNTSAKNTLFDSKFEFSTLGLSFEYTKLNDLIEIWELKFNNMTCHYITYYVLYLQ